MNSGYKNYKVKRAFHGDGLNKNTAQEYLVIGIDLSEEEAIDLNVPIRPGPNGKKYIWLDDINPQ